MLYCSIFQSRVLCGSTALGPSLAALRSIIVRDSRFSFCEQTEELRLSFRSEACHDGNLTHSLCLCIVTVASTIYTRALLYVHETSILRAVCM